MFRALSSENFPPFGKLRLEFPPVDNKPTDLAEVHLLTGVNGTGKTRILCALASMLGNGQPLSKRLRSADGKIHISATDRFPVSEQANLWPSLAAGVSSAQWTRGGAVHDWASAVAAFAYSGMAYITDAPITVMADVSKPERIACLSFVRPEGHSQGLLQGIANLKVQAAMDWMNSSGGNASDTRSTRVVNALESTISRITDKQFSFQVTSYPKAALEVSWGGVKLSFDTLPDGLRSIIGWLAHAVVMMDAWLQGKADPLMTEAVFLLDEIEGLLHPAWQRRILPAFQRLFPRAQIFVATHSPFLIASLNHGWIHQLTIGPDGTVKAEAPISASEGDSYVSVVEDIMGVKEWYDPETEQLLVEFRKQRDAAYRGDMEAGPKARELAAKIGSRSMELDYMMGRELRQMDRQLTRISAK
jgi:predicted ATP-binding protein involved in virulence